MSQWQHVHDGPGIHPGRLTFRPSTAALCHAANVVTASRIVMAIALGALFSLHATGRVALLVLVCAIWFSDILDGLLARGATGARAERGAVFDPIADDFAFLAGFACLLSVGLVPLWFLLLALSGRIAFTLMRAMALVRRADYPFPRISSKVMGATYGGGQIALFAYYAFGDSFAPMASPAARSVVIGIMTATSVVALVRFARMHGPSAFRHIFQS
jgi:phosphatidylglycerophosphate synthase